MEIQTESYDAVELVAMPAQLVMSNARDARRAIKALIDSGRHRLVLDLRTVDFVDSSGLSVLVSALKALRPLAGEVVLLNPSDNIRALIELTRLHKVFEIYEDRDAAINELQRRSVAA